jgi:hypothetical protein
LFWLLITVGWWVGGFFVMRWALAVPHVAIDALSLLFCWLIPPFIFIYIKIEMKATEFNGILMKRKRDRASKSLQRLVKHLKEKEKTK